MGKKHELSRVGRYDNLTVAVTPLDPLEDACAWIASLRSAPYTSDILHKVHGISGKSNIKNLAGEIRTYSENALSFLHQAYSGRAKVAFLPLYYSVLNLSKITIILSGNARALKQQRWHGVSYNPEAKNSRSLINDILAVKTKGALPLLYTALTGQAIAKEYTLAMKEIYPYISGAEFELMTAMRMETQVPTVNYRIEENDKGEFRLLAQLHLIGSTKKLALRNLPAFRGFRRVEAPHNTFRSNSVKASNLDAAKEQLFSMVNRTMLYTRQQNTIVYDRTPFWSGKYFLPEEIPIWLAFYHLSSVVRYKPDFLDRIENSNAWPVILSMRKHAMLRYLLLFWSNVHQKEFVIQVQ